MYIAFNSYCLMECWDFHIKWFLWKIRLPYYEYGWGNVQGNFLLQSSAQLFDTAFTITKSSFCLQSNFIEIILWQGCSPVNLLHIFRTPFFINTSERLLLCFALHRMNWSFSIQNLPSRFFILPPASFKIIQYSFSQSHFHLFSYRLTIEIRLF